MSAEGYRREYREGPLFDQYARCADYDAFVTDAAPEVRT